MTYKAGRIWPFVSTKSKVFDEMEIVSADGVYLYTSDGRKILDASAGAVVGNIGWGREEVAATAAAALTRLTFALPPFATPERLELVERLRNEWLPDHIRKVSFFGSGSEANEAAIRLARQYQLAKGRGGRYKVIGRDVSYSGTSLATLAVGGHTARRRGFEPMMLDMPHAPACYCLRCPMGKAWPSCKVACAHELEALIEREGADSIAGFLAEPIVGTSGGGLVPPDDYWPAIVEICKRHDILLIADEVLTGFGRTGQRFGVDHWNLDADMIVLGKGMSGGYASISGVATTEAVTEVLTNAGMMPMFHTYGGHPVHCATASKVLQIMEREQLVQRVSHLAPVLEQKMRALESHPNVAEVRGRGFLWAVEIVKDKATLARFTESSAITFKLMESTVKQGVFTYFGGTGDVRDVIIVAPHFIIEEAQMDDIVSALHYGITEVCAAA
jgi:adenosylmethionine-8-amino-7-oxononanoate aminotransferase